ncbi:MAG: FAD-dependent oxidoreductase [Myxococcota bacterium]|nr:FAD-dependent oxidoreductase [Myxococcota bacterium]
MADTVAVVGAGLAGLSAAWELQARGVRVALLEREASAGGRAWSGRSRGFLVEPLSPLLSTRPGALSSWVADVGAADSFLPLRPVLGAQAHRGRVVPVDPRRARDFLRVPGVRPHQALRLLRLPRLLRRYGERLDPERPEHGADLDDRSVADFGRLYFGGSVLDRWLAPFVTAPTLADENEASRVQLLSRWRAHFGVLQGLPRAPLRELCEAASAKLPLLAGAHVTAIEPRSDAGFDVVYTRDDRERMLEASAVVLAIPAPEASRLAAPHLTTGEREVLERVKYAPAVSLTVATVRPLSAHPQEIRVPHAEGSPLESALIEPGLPGGRVPDGYGAVTLRATAAFGREALRLPDDAVEKELLDAFEHFEPRARGRAEWSRVLRVPQALPRFDVGHYRDLARLARVEQSRLAEGGRLVLAGDYRMDPSWEGAFAAGRRAARTLYDTLR